MRRYETGDKAKIRMNEPQMAISPVPKWNCSLDASPEVFGACFFPPKLLWIRSQQQRWTNFGWHFHADLLRDLPGGSQV